MSFRFMCFTNVIVKEAFFNLDDATKIFIDVFVTVIDAFFLVALDASNILVNICTCASQVSTMSLLPDHATNAN